MISLVPVHQITLVKSAEAEAEAKYLQGQGMARQRQVRLLHGPVAAWWPQAGLLHGHVGLVFCMVCWAGSL